MNKLQVDLKNCYGIGELKHEFDFTKGSIIGLYAPNGTMKTSFAKTFLRISEGNNPIEEIYNRPSTYSIKIDNLAINTDEIFVIKSFVANYDSTDKISSLLVDGQSKEEYDEIYSKIAKLKNSLVAKLNRLSGVKKEDVEELFLNDINEGDFFESVKKTIELDVDYDFSKINYATIFNNDVIDLLKNEDVEEHIDEYIKKYNELIDEYSFLKHGVFNPNKAENVLKSLKKENFFKAEHSVNLKGVDSPVDEDIFDEKVKEIKDKISQDEKLKEIQTLITKKVSVLGFQDLLEKYPEIIPEIKYSLLPDFKIKLWTSYLHNLKDFIKELIELYDENKVKLKEIEDKANQQQTIWENVIDQFENRFHLPYKLEIENKRSAVLGLQAPNIVFKFKNEETGNFEVLQKKKLDDKDILSQGERRALYLLNILYEVKIRELNAQRTVFIIDDIADSFDYKNKYAIIEYLRDISTKTFFFQIILTHNFDFFRTIQGRLMGNSKWQNSLITIMEGQKVILSDDAGTKLITSPFEKWKGAINTDVKALIATIPFVRNLVEYKEGSGSVNFKTLTTLLHFKNYTDGTKPTTSVEIQDIKPIIEDVLKDVIITSYNMSQKVYDLIINQANNIIATPNSAGINLENKIILAIASRLKAEEYMFSVLNNKSIPTKYQTAKLFKRCKDEFSNGNSNIDNFELLEQVNIMTPENIHLNSFMYEPLIDISENYLKELYSNVKVLI